jgi:hypothetical protein
MRDMNAKDEGVMNSIALNPGWPPVLADVLRVGETIHNNEHPYSEQGDTWLHTGVSIIATDK